MSGQNTADDTGPERQPDVSNPEAVLVSVGALVEGEDGDLVLAEEFKEAWRAEIDDVKRSDAQREEILDVLGLDDGDVEFEVFQEAFKIIVDGNLVGVLESQGAFYADLAGARLLSERFEQWDDLPVAGRSRLLKGLRLFLERCPDCEYDVTFETKEVESCCGSHPVAAVDCGRCGARLFESAPLKGDPPES
jgi:hypothetical protein